jgi:uncharacterized membrane protein
MNRYLLFFLSGILGIIAFAVSYYRLNIIFNLSMGYHIVFVVIMLILTVSTLLYLLQLLQAAKGNPVEDEMTTEVQQKAAHHSFPYILSVWIFLLFFSVESLETVIQLCTGIIAMVLLYTGFWMYYKLRGTRHD